MPYFAEIKDGRVVRVIVADQKFIDSGLVGDPKEWIETAIDDSLRKNYAGIGHTYDQSLDAFVPPKPYASWTLDTDACKWQSPKPSPKDGKFYLWDEPTLDWKVDG